MKTKLTLTVRKSVIERAKKHSRKSGKSISRLFDEPEIQHLQWEQQRAAARLLLTLKKSPTVKALDDKLLLRKHILRRSMADVFLAVWPICFTCALTFMK